MLLKTTEYLDHFARFKRKENVEAVERLLSAHKELAKFERAQLGMFDSLRRRVQPWCHQSPWGDFISQQQREIS